MPLFETTTVDVEVLKVALKKYWNVELGANVKASQNQTYLGEMLSGEEKTKVVVRVTPNPGGKRKAHIDLELRVLAFLAGKSMPVCPAYPELESGALQVALGDLSVSVFHYAKGDPIVFTDWKWMVEEEIVVGVGKFIGKLHLLLDEFENTHPEISASARNWRELHDGVLKDMEVHPDDAESALKTSSFPSPRPFGIVHGDINPSNYFWDASIGLPTMFDWDQLQASWRLYDLSSCVWTVVMLEGAGSPVDMSPVPQANVKQYTNWLIQGYESESGSTVDRTSLERMIDIRRTLYRNFCSRAILELPPGSFMYNFCEFINNWLSGPASSANKSS